MTTDSPTPDSTTPNNKMSKPRAIALVAAGVVAGGVLAGSVAANAADGAPSPSAQAAQPANPHPGKPQRADEKLLTGDTAAKVKAAVLAKYPGATFVRVETDSDGAYEAHIVKKDGTPATVEVNKDFAVTGEERGPRPGCPGPGPGGPRETDLTGDTLAKVKAAVAAKYPGATFDRVTTDRDGAYEADITKKDGTHVTVEVNKSFAVTGEEKHPRPGPGRPGGPGGPGGPGAPGAAQGSGTQPS
jgi:uncharacterized membrane protein YkoI